MANLLSTNVSGRLYVSTYSDVNPTNGAFRFYDGSTFRGGLGLNSWAFGGGSANDLNLYLANDSTLYISTNGINRHYFNSGEAAFKTYAPDLNYKISVVGGDQFNAYYGSGATTLYIQYHGNAGGDVRIAGNKFRFDNGGHRLVIAKGSGTMISNSLMDDAIGWNDSYGIYIGSTIGGTYYIYGNGTFYDNGTIRTLIHSGNIGSQSVSYASSAGNADTLDGYHASSLTYVPIWTNNTQSAERGGFVSGGSWYRVANLGTERFFARVRIYDNSSGGPHASVEFQVSGAFNNSPGYSFNLTSNGYYSAPSVTQVRILSAGTYDPQYLEVYISYVGYSGSTFAVSLLEARNATVVNWDNGSIPSGYSATTWDANAPLAVGGRAAIFNSGIYNTNDYSRFGNVLVGQGTYKNIIKPIDDANLNIHTPSGAVYFDTYGQASGSFRAPIFYDSADTAYYLDPNGTSNLLKFSERTMGFNGMNPMSASSPYEARFNASAGYRNGTMGYGNTDFNTIARNWGSGFIDTWSSPANAPGGSTHYIGLQGVHYSDGGASFYGFQMACAGEADNRFFWRSSWPSMRSWVEMIHSGNIASQSVSYAVTSGTSSATTQTNFSSLTVGGLDVATREYVTSQGYLTSLPSHNHDDRYYTESESDNRYVPYGSITGSFGLNDNKLYLRTNGDNNHYLWNAADDWEELVYYTGTGFRVKGSTGVTAATFTDSGINLPSGSVAQFYTSAGNLRGYIQATDTDDNHFIIATSGGEDIVFKDSGLAGERNMVIRGNASVESYGDFRAPIFYDSNDTNYYLDPNNRSRLASLSTGGVISTNDGFGANLFSSFTADGKYMTRNWSSIDGGYTWPGTTYRTGLSDAPIGSVAIAGSAAWSGHRQQGWTPIDQTKTYKISVWIRATSGNPYCYLSLTQANYDLAQPNNGGWGNPYFWNGVPPSSWTEYTMTIGPSGSGAQYNWNAGTKYVQLGWLHNYLYSGYSGQAEISGFKIEELDDTLANNVTVLGNAYANSSFRAPIFYDSNDTSYYLDPNSTSYLYHLVLSGNSYFRPNSWIQFDGNYGVYWPNHYGLHIYPNNDGSYGSLQVKGSKNSWHGIHFDSGSTLMMNSGETGVHRQGVGWQWRWYNGEMYISAGSTGGGTERTVIHSGNIGSQSVSYATSAGDSTNLGGRSSSRYLYYRGISSSGDFQSFQSTESIIRFDQVNDYNGLSNPPGGYTYGGVLSMRGDNFGFQLWGSHTGDFYFKTQWNNDQYSGWRTVLHSSNYNSYAVPITGTVLTEGNYFYYRSNIGSYLGALSSPPLQAYATGGNSAFMSFHRSGSYAVNFGLDADNVMRIGGWSAAADRWVLDMSGNNTVAGSFRAPIFYDSQNTGYYGDFASTSVMNAIRLGTSTNSGTISGGGDWGIRFANDNGWIQFGPANNSWTHIYTDKNFYFNQNLYVNGTQVVLNSGTWGINVTGSAGSASSSSRSSALDIVGYGDGNMTYYQSSGTFAGYSGWAGYFISNHGNGSNYYNQTIITPFWGPPQYSRLQGGTFVGPYTFWSTENLNNYAPNMDQYVRTTDSVTFNTTTAPTILVNNHSDNTKGYRIHNTSSSSVSAMFVNSSNQLVIAAGAVDQINLNKKVYVNGVALGVNVAPSATAGRIDASNDIVAYSSSDERLKQNITPIENALDKVRSLTGVEFDWKPEYKHAHGYEGHDTGIIAQQVQDVMPSAVRTNDTGFLAVRYEKLIGLLIEANKELAARVEELEKKLK